jgi:hypothetical protein
MISEASSRKSSKYCFRPLCFILLVILFQGNISIGQILTLDRNMQKTFKKGTRTMTGVPGEKYWQNSADYQLNIHFDPATLN